MSDNELEKLRLKKAEMLVNSQLIPRNIININSFDELNKFLTDFPNKIIIIDFWAVWCGPCKFISPIFERLQQEFSQNFIFAKINVDDNPMLSRRFSITGIPTLLFLKNDKIIHRIIGAIGYDQLKEVLEKLK